MDTAIIGYIVTNSQTKRQYAFKSGVKASRACDRMDLAYGAICCRRNAVWSDNPEMIAHYKALKATKN